MAMRTEYKNFTKQELEAIILSAARHSLVNRIYFGQIESQEIVWNKDGGASVLTHHTPAEPGILPPMMGARRRPQFTRD